MILTDPSNRFAFVPCLGSDYVAQYVFDATKGTLTPNNPPTLKTAAGAGPRHIAFHPNGKLVYLLNETASTMTALSLDATSGTLTPIQTTSMLPPGFSGTNTAAEVWVHPSGAWVLGSNRGDDSLVAFSIDAATGKMSSPVFTKSGGVSPRDFTFDPTGSFVFAANEGNSSTPGNVAAFQFDATTAGLTAVGTPVELSSASFVGVVRLPN
jgi:6-phosphogluconolactonase